LKRAFALIKNNTKIDIVAINQKMIAEPCIIEN